MDKKQTAKKKLGRPLNVPGEPRRVRLDVRVTDREIAVLKAEAKRRGMSVTDLLLAPFRKEK